MPDDVLTAIASIADRTHGFRASYIAETTGKALRDVQRKLVEMVDRGELGLEYQLVCPGHGAILKRFKQDQPLPIGEEIEADDCEPFVAEKRHFLVAYLPEAPLLQSILESERSGKARARLRGNPASGRPGLGDDLAQTPDLKPGAHFHGPVGEVNVVDGEGNTQVVGDANAVAGRDAASGQSAIVSGTTSTASVSQRVPSEREARVPVGHRIAAVVFLLVLIAGIVLLVLGVLGPAIVALVIGAGGFGLAIFKLFFDQ